MALAAPATAATADAAPTSQTKPIASASEEFTGTASDIQCRLRTGISPWPDNLGNRIHYTSGERAIFAGRPASCWDFLGIASPIGAGGGVVSITDRPMTVAERKAVADKAAGELAKGKIVRKQYDAIVASPQVSGLLASRATFALDDGAEVQARFRVSRLKGRWSSIYLADWMRGLELDVIEFVGDRGGTCYNFSVHWAHAVDFPKVQTALICPGAGDLRKGWHLYGVRRVGQELRPMFDGREVPASAYKVYVDYKGQPAGTAIRMPPAYQGAAFNWVINVTYDGWPRKIGQAPTPGSVSQAYADWIRTP